jgi:trypsin-like peptidase
MPDRKVLERIKAATVAIAMQTPGPFDPTRHPFRIVGTGFCISPDGIVITCEHVIAAFSKVDPREAIAALPKQVNPPSVVPVPTMIATRPEVLFYRFDGDNDRMSVIPAVVAEAVAKLEYDLGAIRLHPHPGFARGYPFLDIADFALPYEGLEVGTCGFPMGNDLHLQLRTASSSFTRGIVSSIAPAPGAKPAQVTGLQLDITATFGNSGGPVFDWSDGQVIGVLQGGPTQQDKKPLPGLAHAEPLYRIMTDGTIDRLRNSDPHDG